MATVVWNWPADLFMLAVGAMFAAIFGWAGWQIIKKLLGK
jgi:hypothetical protein